MRSRWSSEDTRKVSSSSSLRRHRGLAMKRKKEALVNSWNSQSPFFFFCPGDCFEKAQTFCLLSCVCWRLVFCWCLILLFVCSSPQHTDNHFLLPGLFLFIQLQWNEEKTGDEIILQQKPLTSFDRFACCTPSLIFSPILHIVRCVCVLYGHFSEHAHLSLRFSLVCNIF